MTRPNTNRLKIDAAQLKLEFSGSRDDIRRGYEMTRELLIMHFHQQLATAEPTRVTPDGRDADTTTRDMAPLPSRSVTQAQWAPPQESLHISLVLCSELYNKVCVLERDAFAKSAFGATFAFEHIQRIYLPSSQAETFKQHFTFGKTLWRELTPHGRSAMRAEP